MLSICICPGCPGKKKHKTTASKECVWYNKLSNVKNKDVPQALKQLAIDFLPTSVHDVAEVLLEKKNSNCSNKNSSQDTVECVDFLDTIELNNDDNSVGVDLDA
eukprot:2428525-Ditylum_brightwellii.AAC.1